MLEPARGLGAEAPPALYLTSRLLGEAGLPHLFTTRHFPGVTSPRDPGSPFDPRAVTLLAELGIAREPAAFLRQVHGADAIAVERGGLAGRGDILTTGRPALPLAIFTADCLAIVLCDADAGVLALAHVGWRGTVHGAAQAAVRAVSALGARPGRLRAVIAPSIGPCCYEVDEPVTSELARAYPGRWEAWVRPAAHAGRVMLDLWAANEALLVEAGVDPARIENPRRCTACEPALFYSYRKGNRGRLATLAALP